MPEVSVTPAQPGEMDEVRRLFLAYAGSLNFSLCFQGFEEELADLPGKYAPPEGIILLGRAGGRNLGVVALRDLGEGICEMKRLYVSPEARGLKLGRRLAEAVIAAARAAGYQRMRLDTLAQMVQANHLYNSLGFVDIPPYYHNPLPTARYLELML